MSRCIPSSDNFEKQTFSCEVKGKLFRAVKGYIMRNVVGEFLLIPVALESCDTSKVSIFNETGAFLWQKLSNKKSFDDLVGELLEEFDVVKKQAENDVEDFLRLLIKNKLIHIETEVM